MKLVAKILRNGRSNVAHHFRLAAIGGSVAPAPSTKPATKGRKKMSAAGRAKIAAAQKARWAKVKGTSPVVKPAKKKGGISPEGRARIAAAQKARWAAKKR